MPRNRIQAAIGPAVERVAGSPLFARVAPGVIPPLDRALNRLTGGRVVLSQYMLPSLVLTTTGHRTGLPRRAPLACLPEPGGRYVVVGSNFGREHHPVWTENLLRTPSAQVTRHGRTTPVTAQLLTGEERAGVWPALVAMWPVYDRYTERSGRELRVFRLTPGPRPSP